MRIPGIVLVALAAGGIAGCGFSKTPSGPASVENLAIRHDDATETCCAGTVYRARATGYYPASDAMEGGYLDRRGKRLRTLQDFIDGRAPSVSVAMDAKEIPYGTRVCIPDLNAKYGKAIPFRVVDTGGAFRAKRTTRIDICTRSRADAHAKSVNRSLEIVVCDP